MRKVFLENLPIRENGRYKGKINWEKCAEIKIKVKFTYDDIQDEVEIVGYYRKNKCSYLQVKYNKNIYNLSVTEFIDCKIGKSLKIYKKKIISQYKYQIGNIITDIKSGKLEILEQIRIKSGRSTRKGYKYKCLTCGNIDIISEGSIDSHNGCNACCNFPQKLLVGYNDIWTTNPNLAKLLANPEDGYKYTEGANKKTDWVCPDCGNIIKNKHINSVNKQGLSCPKCSDGISYPEKFVYNVLQQLNINFQVQLSKVNFKWCKEYKYDFYILSSFIIIESHGIQHYEESFSKIKSNTRNIKTLAEEQENDRIKKELALQNGIKEENYIVIDCRESNLDYIKNNILDSRLNDLFDLSVIDWLKCHEFACNSLIKSVCDLWNNGIHSAKEIGKVLKLGKTTVERYLHRGTNLKWCNYENQIKTKIICLNNKEIFNSIKEAENLKNITGINHCCQNMSKYSGKDFITGEYLQWQYYNEYLINPKKLLTNEEINLQYQKPKIKVICLNTFKIFESISQAKKYYQLKSSGGITKCCQGKQKSFGVDSETGEPLYWMYYEVYLKLNENNNKVI